MMQELSYSKVSYLQVHQVSYHRSTRLDDHLERNPINVGCSITHKLEDMADYQQDKRFSGNLRMLTRQIEAAQLHQSPNETA